MLDKKVHTGVLKSAFVVTKDFDHGFDNDGDTIEVTEWTNMLGFNIDLNRTSPAGKNLGETVRSMNVTQLIDMQESLDKLNKFLEDHLNNKKK